jgi:predicted O-methyltransferase YrrM
MEIISQNDYIEVINANKHHLKNLLNIVKQTGEELEGDSMYENNTFLKIPELLTKQRNLYTIAKTGNNIIEIGFNAGSSALIFLLSNPNAHIWCFDICTHSYTKACFEYLYENFDRRISLYEGNSIEILPNFFNDCPNKTFDVFHIDGSTDLRISNIDFFTCFNVANNNSIIIWEHTELHHRNFLWEHYISSKKVIPLNMLPTYIYTHLIGFVYKPYIKIAVCSLNVGEKYKNITKYGQKSKILYCQKHNYDFFDEETDVDYTRPLAWSKINIIKKHLPDYDYILWVDGDTLIMNDKITIDSLIQDFSNEKDITVAQDWKMLNTGVMLIKNTKWTMNFLNLIYDQTQFISHDNWEQAAFINLLENNISDSKNHINVLPIEFQNKLNSYWYTYFFNDCFILHFPGCYRLDNERGLSYLMNQYCPIQKDDETFEEYTNRIHWLEHESRQYILLKLKNEN